MKLEYLTTVQSMQQRFKQLRGQSRQEMLNTLYQKSQMPRSQIKVESDFVDAFTFILKNYNYDKQNPLVRSVLSLFDIKLQSLNSKTEQYKIQYIVQKITLMIDEQFSQIFTQTSEQKNGNLIFKPQKINPQQFEWIGVKCKYSQLRSIFQEILLEKVRMFDQQLKEITQCQDKKFNELELSKSLTTALTAQTVQTARTASKIFKSVYWKPDVGWKRQISNKKQSICRTMEKNGFCDVQIRDKTEFSLVKWNKKQEKQLQKQKKFFRDNFNKIRNVPLIFQFVKKYTKTTKARDNIYRKWQNREKEGITPEQLRYLCATSLFLNRTLNNSEKMRIQMNVKLLTKNLLSKLEANIAQKIIETYKKLMKKVIDLRAKYYENLTDKSKKKMKKNRKKTFQNQQKQKKYQQYLKYLKMFKNILNSDRMSIKLNKKVYRWVCLFIKNMKICIKKTNKIKSQRFLQRFIEKNKKVNSTMLKIKKKYPSSKIIKRQYHSGLQTYSRKYVPMEKFYYEPAFENTINKLNSIEIKDVDKRINLKKQFSGGPHETHDYLIVKMPSKQIMMTSKKCLQAIIIIQSKWRAIYQRKIYLQTLQQYNLQMEKDFQKKKQSLFKLYPKGKPINICNRLKNVNKIISQIIKPYKRVIKRPIRLYTTFSSKYQLYQLKQKYFKNTDRRYKQCRKMVMDNQYLKLKHSGIVLSSKEINFFQSNEQANMVWWSIYHCNLELLLLLLEGGGDPNSHDLNDNTCLHIAMLNHFIQIIFVLLDYGADLNKKNKFKVTPLYYATTKVLKVLKLQDGIVYSNNNGGQALKDNNYIYYKNCMEDDIYNEHYY